MINWKGILIFFFCFLTIRVFPQEYNLRNFNSEDGLAQPYIYSIIQDKQGYLWVGTGDGLFRYNGFIFDLFNTSDSLADNFITSAINDTEGLWFGHMNGHLSYFNGKKFHTVRMPRPNLSPITHFAESPDAQIWVSTYSDGLLKLDKETGVVKQYLFKNPAIIISFDFLDNGELLVGTQTGLSYCRLNESDEIEIIRPVPEIPESKVTCIKKMRNKSGFFISVEDDGIFQLTHDDNTIKVSKIIAVPDLDLTGIQDIYEDSHSNLWLCSKGKGNGLIRISYSATGESAKFIYFNKANKFVTDDVNTVFEDLEGNIWSGNFGQGLTQIAPKIFSICTIDNVLYGNNIFSLWSDRQYRWIGTENGLVKMDLSTGKILKFYSKSSGLPKDTVTTIYSNDGKVLWIGTEKNGLFRMETGNEKIISYNLGEGKLENSINIITGKGEQVWIGTKKGLCNINTGTNTKKWYSINQGGLPHNYIRCLFIDRSGIIWITTPSNILAYIIDEKVIKIPVRSNTGVLTLGPITEDTDSRIWVGSNGKGVFRIEVDSIFNFTAQEGLLSNYCYSLISDDNKNIWVGHKGGLSRIKTVNFSVKPIQYIESITDNYQFNPNAIFKDQQGEIWFGSEKGMVYFDPLSDDIQLQPPVLGITSIKINDEETENNDKIILSPGRYKIRIEFLGISLKEPALVTYQYKLEGYEQWSEITKNTWSTYNRLTEGDYTFTLKATSGDGIVSEKPLIKIIIKTPFWKRTWFFPIISLLLITLTFIYIRRREFRFLAEKKILEEKVLERTYEIQCQKHEIEIQRDTIEEKNLNITSSITYASYIQNALLPPIDLLDILFPENFIFTKPKDIVSGDFYWLAEKNNKIIFTVADGTGHGVPGAFMSLLGITLLNEIVNIRGITKADAILSNLRDEVTRALLQGRRDIPTSDGMDIALCVLDQSQNMIQFSGGMNNLVYIRDKKLEEVKGNRFSVCALSGIWGPFTMNEFQYRKGDVYYLFSDGYQDQFGGDFDKKFLRQHFYLTLLEIHELPMIKQKEILGTKLEEWKKNNLQTDDITIMGIRI